MAKTAEELRREIEEYLDLRIRSKAPADRTHREELLLQKLEAASEDLILQERQKLRQQESALESISDIKLADLLRIATETKRIRRRLMEEEE